MAYKLTPIIKKIMSILGKEGYEIVRMSGSHIVINKNPKLPRPIVIPNYKELSNVVRLNLLRECKNADLKSIKDLEKVF